MFLIHCDNKGCGKNTQAVINNEDNQVYCADCDKTITNVTQFTKAQLRNLKQVKRPKKESFSAKCHVCSHESLPKLVDDKLICGKCATHLVKIPKPFEILTKEAILFKYQDEKDENIKK
jgi:Zn finger protein HypA/HybF involved in hydrogenase expression